MKAEHKVFWSGVADLYEELSDKVEADNGLYSCCIIDMTLGWDDPATYLQFIWEEWEGRSNEGWNVTLYPVPPAAEEEEWQGMWADNEYGDRRREFCAWMCDRIREEIGES